MRGFRCLKCIYLTIHNPKLEKPIGPAQQALFDQGNQVGEFARTFFPGGILVDNLPWDFVGSLKRTRELLTQKTKIIYEAAFEFKGCYARTDILEYSPDTNRWKIYEVKSGTKVKDEYLDDIGLQVWIIANSGLPIEQVNIMYINNECVYPHLENLFITEDLTATLRERYKNIAPKMNEIFTTIRKPEVVEVGIGPYCLDPNECGFKDHCWKENKVPEYSILDLPQLNAKKWELYNNGIIELDDPRFSDPEYHEQNELQKRMVEVYKTKKRFINKEGVQLALKDWKFPLIFLDFETINPAIPRYNGTSPYTQVPFQFSVHVMNHIADSNLQHFEFLFDQGSEDPRPQLIPALLEACKGEGSIVAYYSKFEVARINEMAAFAENYSPHFKEPLEALVPRVVDPLPIFRENIYDNAFAGSFSLKLVGPAILGEEQSYKGMEIGDGNAAQRGFEELISDKTTDERKLHLRKAMLEYCRKDTLVMVELVKWLFEQIE